MPDRAAIVTGGTRGIGRAIAQALAQDGYALTITGRQPDNVQTAVRELQADGAEVNGIARNLTDPEAPGAIVAEHAERFGRLDVLVNSAGIGIAANADAHQTKHLDLMLGVNVRAIILFYREALGLLRAAAAERGQAHVINLSSLAGKSGQPWLSVYSATKAAVVSYTEAMTKELAGDNIKSTALCPGFVDTEMADFIRQQDPEQELIPTSDMVAAVRFLLATSPTSLVPEIVFQRASEISWGG